jgi:hypothetical protein
MIETRDNFTGDFLALVGMRGAPGIDQMREALLQIDGDYEEMGEVLKMNFIGAIAPDMVKALPIVQQIVGRAVMEHVEWAAVARSLCVRHELN